MEKKLPYCAVCKTRKPPSEFYTNKNIPGRLYNRCKTCDKARNREQDRKEYMREYMKKNREENPHKWAARTYARKMLKKQPCMECGAEKVQAHHHVGYAPENWLNVQWLCKKHHMAAHYSKH